jgi:hypothetical protein
MPASASRSIHQPERFGRLWWLPSRGAGNGLSDTGWAPIAEIDARVIRALLAELRTAAIPAHAAAVTRRPRRSRGHDRAVGEPPYRLWVGTSAYSRAEEVLRTRLPVLLERAGCKPAHDRWSAEVSVLPGLQPAVPATTPRQAAARQS